MVLLFSDTGCQQSTHFWSRVVFEKSRVSRQRRFQPDQLDFHRFLPLDAASGVNDFSAVQSGDCIRQPRRVKCVLCEFRWSSANYFQYLVTDALLKTSILLSATRSPDHSLLHYTTRYEIVHRR
ncbi:hypothetical protein SRHO_G00116200 [Serrasalmus rhombeus]